MKNLTLYNNCKLIKGYLRDVIIDLEREKYFFIPKGISSFLNNKIDLTKISIAEKEIINEYTEFLTQNRLAFFPDDPFIRKVTLNNNLLVYSKISNCILWINVNTNLELIKKIENKLDEYGCQALLLIFRPKIKFEFSKKILESFYESKIRCIEIIAEYSDKHTEEEVEELLACNSRIISFSFYHSSCNKILYVGKYKQILQRNLVDKLENLLERSVLPPHLVINIPFYNESVLHNPFYLKKLILDDEGNIYSNLSVKHIAGNILTQDVLEVINKSTFEFVNISKSKIDICKHCEFKNICPDNRIPKKRIDKTWYQQTECNYNPYIAKWNGEKGYKTLIECGISCNEKGFKINKKKLNRINVELWN